MARIGKGKAGARLFGGAAPISRFVLARQLELMRALLPKGRGARLLEANCGEGNFFSLYASAGFDVCAAEPDRSLRAKAFEGHREIEVYPAFADHLPLADNAVDWVILRLRENDAEKCVRECMRVASRGIVVTFWNSASLAALCWKMGGRGHAWPSPGHTGVGIWKMLRGLNSGRLTSRSTLTGPVSTWNEDSAISWLNSFPGRSLLGAWCAIRDDFGQPGLATPLGLTIRHDMRKPMPAMESRKVSRTAERTDT